MKRALAAVLVSAVVLGALVFVLADLETIRDVLESVRLADLALAFGIYLCAYLGRLIRFAALLGVPPARLGRLLHVSVVHAAAVRVMPARSGEVLFPVLAARELHVDAGDGVAMLVLSRLFDFLGLVLFFVCALLFAGSHAEWMGAAALPAGIGLALLLVLLLIRFTFFVRLGQRLAERIAAGRLGRFGPVRKVAEAASQGTEAAIRATTPARLLAGLLGTVLVWIGIFGCFWALMRPEGLDPISVVLGATAGALAGALPINGIGAFGSHEAGWTLGFTLLGLSGARALATGLMTNVVTSLFALALGGLSLLLYPLLRCRESADPGQDHGPG